MGRLTWHSWIGRGVGNWIYSSGNKKKIILKVKSGDKRWMPNGIVEDFLSPRFQKFRKIRLRSQLPLRLI